MVLEYKDEKQTEKSNKIIISDIFFILPTSFQGFVFYVYSDI